MMNNTHTGFIPYPPPLPLPAQPPALRMMAPLLQVPGMIWLAGGVPFKEVNARPIKYLPEAIPCLRESGSRRDKTVCDPFFKRGNCQRQFLGTNCVL